MPEDTENQEPEDAGSDMDLETPVDLLELHEVGEWLTAVAKAEDRS